MHLYRQRACYSPEPEGSEMMLHHSYITLSKKIADVKEKVYFYRIYLQICHGRQVGYESGSKYVLSPSK